ncbi:MAG: hypothetical protein U0900_18930 [Myxococcota bacterium]
MSTPPFESPETPRPPSRFAERSRRVVDPALLQRFVDTFLYGPDAFFVDELTRVDPEARVLEGVLDTTRVFPLSRCQRTSALHPAHVSAAELLMATGSLGCLHAFLFHGCRWDEAWAGFGNRIHRADFKRVATIGPPITLESRETRTRVGPRRIMLRYDFRFLQAGEVVYRGDQSAMFVKGRALDALLAAGGSSADEADDAGPAEGDR